MLASGINRHGLFRIEAGYAKSAADEAERIART